MDFTKLMDLPGAMAAFTYTDKGELQGHTIREGNEITPQVLGLLTRTCVANQAIAAMEASGWEEVTGQTGFQPLQGFSVVGLEWSVVMSGNCGVIAKNRDVDYEATFSALQAI